MKPTDENAPNDTPDEIILFKDKNDNVTSIRIYGNTIAFLYPEDKYPEKYRLYGYDMFDFEELCEKLDLPEAK